MPSKVSWMPTWAVMARKLKELRRVDTYGVGDTESVADTPYKLAEPYT